MSVSNLAEVGNTVIKRTGNAIVYKTRLNGVYCQLIYTFKDNRLRTAGYLSNTPIPDADNLIREAVDKYGVPDIHETYMDGLQEMVWKRSDNVIFANLYPSFTKISSTDNKYSRRGLFKDLLRKQLPEQNAGTIQYWDATYVHVDPAFFNELHEVNFPLSELSFYEEKLTGVIMRSHRTQIQGLGTIPK